MTFVDLQIQVTVWAGLTVYVTFTQLYVMFLYVLRCLPINDVSMVGRH